MMAFKFTPEEQRYIEHRAKRLRMTMSDYLRYAAVYEGVSGLDPEAFKLMRLRSLARVRLAIRELAAELEQEGGLA